MLNTYWFLVKTKETSLNSVWISCSMEEMFGKRVALIECLRLLKLL